MEAVKQGNLFSFAKQNAQRDIIDRNNSKFSNEKQYFKGSLLQGLNNSDLNDKSILNIRMILSQNLKQLPFPDYRINFIKALEAEILIKKSTASPKMIQKNLILQINRIL